MKALVFDLYLCQPVLIARTEPGDENSAGGLAFIPGSTIRGALVARRLASLGRTQFTLQTDLLDNDWFFKAKVFLHAYPTGKNGDRSLPVPLSWRVEKDSRALMQATIHDLAAEGKEIVMQRPVSPAEPFFCQGSAGNQIQLFSPRWLMEIHNSGWTRRVKGEGDSQVFRYEALDAGQTFTAAILGDDPEAFQKALQLSNGTQLSIGRSRSAHYGKVELRNLRVETNWTETDMLLPSAGQRIALILTSDAIVTDETGQPALTIDGKVGVPSVEAWYRTRVIGGFNRTWGHPLPDRLALQAGSVFVYEAVKIPQETLKDLVDHGIGERRIEGYGRLRAALLVPQLQRESLPYEDARTDENNPPELSGSKPLAQKIGEQYLKMLLEKKLIAAVSGISLMRLDDRAQLSRLRSQLRAGAEDDSLEYLSNHLMDLKSSKDKVKQARIGKTAPKETGPRLDEWIQDLVADATTSEFWGKERSGWGWQQFFAPTSYEKADMIGAVPEKEVLTRLKRIFLRRLIDAVLQKASREIQQQQRTLQKEEAADGNN